MALAHRIGHVGIGEPSVILAVSSAHRREALEVTSNPNESHVSPNDLHLHDSLCLPLAKEAFWIAGMPLGHR